MILHHVTENTCLVKISAATDNGITLQGVDLNIGDMVPIPERFETGIGKTEGKDVLDCRLGQVMVDSKKALFREQAKQLGIQSLRGIKIVSERLFNHQDRFFTEPFLANGLSGCNIDGRRQGHEKDNPREFPQTGEKTL